MRILLWSLPVMLNDILSELIRSQPDLILVEVPRGITTAADAAAILQPQVVILGLDQEGSSSDARELLHALPDGKVLAIEASGRRAWLYELRPYQVLIGEVSPSELLERIRQAFRAESEVP